MLPTAAERMAMIRNGALLVRGVPHDEARARAVSNRCVTGVANDGGRGGRFWFPVWKDVATFLRSGGVLMRWVTAPNLGFVPRGAVH